MEKRTLVVRIVCAFLAALMVLGSATVIISFLAA